MTTWLDASPDHGTKAASVSGESLKKRLANLRWVTRNTTCSCMDEFAKSRDATSLGF